MLHHRHTGKCGLRDYGTASWAGGDAGCDHKEKTARNDGGRSGVNGFHGSLADDSDKGAMNYRDSCRKCGATRIDRQLGLEPTPELYVERMAAVFREVKRVLRDDGTVWVNLGDSYAGNGQTQPQNKSILPPSLENGPKEGMHGELFTKARAGNIKVLGLKPKDLVGIPWRVAFALQKDGWYLRSDIIWSKPNPMPESVTDRPTKAHEYIFLLTKNERYYFDQDAVREPLTDATIDRDNYRRNGFGGGLVTGMMDRENDEFVHCNPAGRNIRTVWTMPTQSFPEAHFATYPEELAERCIKAGTSEKGACSECGAPWERVVEKTGGTIGSGGWQYGDLDDSRVARNRGKDLTDYKITTLGWQPTCTHDAPATPCVVLDPFSGAGTTALVADKLGRFGIGLELKKEYCDMAYKRCYDDAPLLTLV